MRKIIIKPRKGFEALGLKELVEYRDLLYYNILKNIKGKYRQMALGPLWIILQPVVNMLLFTFIFGRVAKMDSIGVPYPLLVIAALIPWNFFQNATTYAANSLVSQMNIISKVYFPRMIIPLSDTISWLIDFFFTLIVLFAMMIIYSVYPNWHILFLPLYIFFVFITTISIGLWTASLTVKFRDVRLFIDYGLRILMFLTPVAYPASVLKSSLSDNIFFLIKLNPMFWVTEGFRWTLLGTSNPPTIEIIYSIILVVTLLFSGLYIFKRSERNIVDLL
jgi:lipopolysaccharide transport system permease protein